METVSSTDGVELAVHDLGGSGRPLLLCHATGFHGRVWSGVAAEFPDRRCLALDFRGFGDSTPPAGGDFDWSGFADDVLAVIDHFDLAGGTGGEVGVQAIGHSKGGAALLLAELARPGTMDRLVCFEPIVFPPPGTVEGGDPNPSGAENPLAAVTRRRIATFDSYEAAIERYASKPPLGSLRPDVLEAYVRHGFRPTDDGRVTLKAEVENEARTYEMGGRRGFEQLPEIGCPVLVCASGDGAGPAMIAPAIAQQLPQGELARFDQLGHFGPLEDPVAFASVARSYLER